MCLPFARGQGVAAPWATGLAIAETPRRRKGAARMPVPADSWQNGCQLPTVAALSCHYGLVAGTRAVTAAARPESWPGGVDQVPAESAEARHYELHERERSY
jgi:hypothetical protein